MSQLVRTPSSLLRLPAPITGGADRDRGAIRYPMISDPTRRVMSAGISGGGGSRGSITMSAGMRAAISSCGVACVGDIGGPVMTGAASREGAVISPRASRLRRKSGNQNVAIIDEDNTKTMQVNEVPAVESRNQNVTITDKENNKIMQVDEVPIVESGNQALNPVSDDTTTVQVNKVLVAEFEHQNPVPISFNTTTVQPDGALQIKPARLMTDDNNLEEEHDIGQIEIFHERIHKKDYTVETLMRIKPRKPMSAKQMTKIGRDVLHEMEKLKGIPKEEVEPLNASGYFEAGFAPTALAVVTSLEKAMTLPAYVQFRLNFCAPDKAKEYIRTVVYSKLKRVHPFKQFFEHWERLSLGNTALGAWKFLQVRLPGDKAAERKEGGTMVDEEEDAKR